MKHTVAQIPAPQDETFKITIPAVAADCKHTFGYIAVVLPSANHDLETSQTVSKDEQEQTNQYFKELARHLYANMGGGDIVRLRNALNELPLRN